MRGSKTARPIMAVLDALGRRWALRVGWELRHGARSFNDLQRACDRISPSVLSQRLQEGIALGTTERDEQGRYRATADGRALNAIVTRLDRWAERLAARKRRAAATRTRPPSRKKRA